MELLLSLIPVFLLGTGFFYLLKLKGFYLLHPRVTFRSLFQRPKSSGISPIKALSLALAGTLGVGNIVGVATALYLGGPGAVFWMIFSALVAMVLKYAEILLAVKHRRFTQGGQPEGGAPYYITDGFSRAGFPRLGRGVALVFGILCLINTFTMGSMLQSNAVAGALNQGFGIPMWLTGILIGLLCIPVIKGGASRVSHITGRVVPLMTIGFLGLCVGVLVLRYDRIGSAVCDIFRSAFDVSCVGGGVIGFLTSSGVRYGIMRGLVSNEAGCGTAPMAHAAAETHSPAAQGVLGLVEVFVDTILLCGITALAIMVSDSGPYAYGEDGVRTAQAAFSSVLGDWAGYFFALAVLFFGLATILCWAHYGMTALRALLRGKVKLLGVAECLFPPAFALTVLLGAVAAPSGVWSLADGALGVMTLINLLVLLGMHREVAEETKAYMDDSKKRARRGRPPKQALGDDQ